jgi:hypothetical protein
LADTGTIGQTGRTDTFTGSTDLTADALSAAGSTMVYITVGIDARAGARSFILGAIGNTLATGAKLSRLTFIFAFTAMIRIDRGIYTNTRAIIE